MALIKLGGLAQDVRGSLNGSVFSRNRGGAYVRSKVSACQPVSAFSSAARAIFKALAQYWSQTLTDGQRAAWEAFAALHPYTNVFGDSLTLSGIAMFEAVNRAVRQVAGAFITDPPATFVSDDLGDTTLTITAAGGVVNNAELTIGRALAYGEGLYVFATIPGRWTQKAQKADFRLVNNPANGLYDVGDDFSADLLTRCPGTVWTAADFITIKVRALNLVTGAQSAPISLRVVIA